MLICFVTAPGAVNGDVKMSIVGGVIQNIEKFIVIS
jgi:hypothetical protein